MAALLGRIADDSVGTFGRTPGTSHRVALSGSLLCLPARSLRYMDTSSLRKVGEENEGSPMMYIFCAKLGMIEN